MAMLPAHRAPNDTMSSMMLYIGLRCPMTSVDATIATPAST